MLRQKVWTQHKGARMPDQKEIDQNLARAQDHEAKAEGQLADALQEKAKATTQQAESIRKEAETKKK